MAIVSTYKQTIFIKRSSNINDTRLWVSRAVQCSDKHARACWLLALKEAHDMCRAGTKDRLRPQRMTRAPLQKPLGPSDNDGTGAPLHQYSLRKRPAEPMQPTVAMTSGIVDAST